MTIRRIVPDIPSQEMEESREFYQEFLGLKLVMDLGFVITFVSPENPTAQLSVVREDTDSAGCRISVLRFPTSTNSMGKRKPAA